MFKLILAKRRRHFASKNCKREKNMNEEEDKISGLPDEILVFILSLLTTKEAARTNVLSHRLQKVWTFIPCLKFDTWHKLEWKVKGEVFHAERLGYINWVNRVLDSYQGSAIDEFKIQFNLDENDKDAIDTWVSFAFEKNVKELVFDLRRSSKPTTKKISKNYAFPASLHLVGYFPNYSFMRVIELKRVDVSGDVIEWLLLCCPYLAILTLVESDSLVDLRVDGRSLSLKHLTVRHCRYLKSLHVSATNLLSLKYSGETIDISYGNLPNLILLHLGSSYADNVISNFSLLSSIASQLVTLKLMTPVKGSMFSQKFPLFRRVKNLTVRLGDNNADNVLLLASLFEACPSLHTFMLVMSRLPGDPPTTTQDSRILMLNHTPPHQCLKVAELVGMGSCLIECEFVRYLRQNAVMLEKLVLDPLQPTLLSNSTRWVKKDGLKLARLLKRTPRHKETVVLRNCDQDGPVMIEESAVNNAFRRSENELRRLKSEIDRRSLWNDGFRPQMHN